MSITSFQAFAEAQQLKNFVHFGRKIVCVGRNYKAHAAELGNAVPTTPLLFLKPTSCYITEPTNIIIPKGVEEVHHEIELGIVISKPASFISPEDATTVIGGYALGLDLTARDIQSAAKKKGYPWSEAKGYDTFCPISEFVEPKKIDHNNTRVWCSVNGEMRQDGNTSNMIFNIPELISHISTIFQLERGDVILTGTPEGVGPLVPGDVIKAGMSSGDDNEDVVTMEFKCTKRE